MGVLEGETSLWAEVTSLGTLRSMGEVGLESSSTPVLRQEAVKGKESWPKSTKSKALGGLRSVRRRQRHERSGPEEGVAWLEMAAKGHRRSHGGENRSTRRPLQLPSKSVAVTEVVLHVSPSISEKGDGPQRRDLKPWCRSRENVDRGGLLGLRHLTRGVSDT